MAHHHHARHVARAAEANPEPAQTLVSIVYVTASPTFTGAIAGYTTIGANDDDTPTTEAAAKSSTSEILRPSKSKSAAAVQSSILIASSSPTSLASVVRSSSSSTPSVILAPTTSIASTIALLAATGSTTTSRSSSRTASTAAASAASASSTASADADQGMSTGGKAGLAFGVICLVGVALALALFFFRKRKNALKHEQLDNEKNDIFAGNSAAARAASVRTANTASAAPRLSLRPITQNFAMFGAEKRASRGNGLDQATSQASINQNTVAKAPQTTQAQEQNKSNPFGNHAETIDPVNTNGPPAVEGMSADGKIVAGSAIGVATTTAAATTLARGASKRGNGPKPLDFTKPMPMPMPQRAVSPAGTEFSMSSEKDASAQSTPTGAAIAAAGGPPNTAVHRVQLDFKPSMEDELELKAGQLIRLLHEYDDGWALCIRLDRSQQGVVPRTCLSTRPVKPRPQQNGPRGPPPGMRVPTQNQGPMSPGMQGPPSAASTFSSGPRTPMGNLAPRPMTPNGNQNRPMNPNGNQNRPMTPNGNQNRPMTPNGGPQYTPQTPKAQGQGRVRSPTVTQGQAPRVQPGPSPMNPVEAAPAPYPDSRPSTPQAQEHKESPPPAAPSAVERKPVPGQAL
ncbi:hypothetical protein PVAG01_00995 [Phlyctema vagabunda]|uniref:SH3 domain-containing protein n=1 Tax=Phlyctema vagabunda TaxID=108571 RepID=A0ABR4PVW5_9HELO